MEYARPFISVVVPTFNRPKELRNCLGALASQTYPKSRFQVIVVDDGGTSNLEIVSEPLEKKLDLCILKQANAGPGAARNKGVERARGDLVAFTDDDCIVDAHWLESLANHHWRHPEALLGGSSSAPADCNRYSQAAQLILDSAYRFHNSEPLKAQFFASNNMAVPVRPFKELCGFDTSFNVASEDRDLCRRWRLRGWPLHSVPEAGVLHVKKLDLTGYVRQYFRYGQGAWRFHNQATNGEKPAGSVLRKHFIFLRQVRADLRQAASPRKVRMILPLILWQASNLAGYGYASIRSRVGAD